MSTLYIAIKEKEKAKETFEPLPLYVPQFEMPSHNEEDEQDFKNKEEKSERGVWIMEI